MLLARTCPQPWSLFPAIDIARSLCHLLFCSETSTDPLPPASLSFPSQFVFICCLGQDFMCKSLILIFISFLLWIEYELHEIPIPPITMAKIWWHQTLARMWSNRNSHSLLMKIQNDTAALEDSAWFLTKLNILILYKPAVVLLGIYSKDIQTYSKQKFVHIFL